MKKLGVFWNVERFFDTDVGPISRAYGGTSNKWNQNTYSAKLNAVCAILQDISQHNEIALLGLCEVESAKIIDDIINTLGWSYLVDTDKYFNNPSLTGLDVALLFSKKVFYSRPHSVKSYAIGGGIETRDMLHAELIHKKSKKPVHIIVVHWMSRLISEGNMSRLGQAFLLRQVLERTLKFPKEDLVRTNGKIMMPNRHTLLARWETPMIIMGDFNDEPYNDSISKVLRTYQDKDVVYNQTKLSEKETTSMVSYLKQKIGLWNPTWSLLTPDNGNYATYYLTPRWRAYDQIMGSRGTLINESHLRISNGPTVYREKSVFDAKGERVQILTRGGYPRGFNKSKLSGVSDHLPLLFELEC